MARKKTKAAAETPAMPAESSLLTRLREMTPAEVLLALLRTHWRPLIVVLLFAVVWIRPIFYPFVLDDTATVSATATTGRPARLTDALTAQYWRSCPPSAGAWRPLTALSLFVNGSAASAPAPKPGEPWSEDNALPYRAAQVALLALAAWLVARMAARIGVPAGAAWVAGLVFAIHPIRVDAVQRLEGRADLLLTVFVLAGLLALLSYLERPRRGSLALLALAQAGAILSNEAGWVLLPVAAAVAALHQSGNQIFLRTTERLPADPLPHGGPAATQRPLGHPPAQGQSRATPERGGPGKILGLLTRWARWPGWRTPTAAAVGALASVLVLATIAGWVTLGAPGITNARIPDDIANPLLRHPWWPAHLLTPLYAAAHGWFLHFWPIRLKIDYGFNAFPVVVSAAQPAVWKAAALLTATAAAGYYWRRVPGLVAGMVLFFLAFLPASNLLYLNRDLFSERALTLAGAGWAIAAAAAWAGLANLAAPAPGMALLERTLTRRAALDRAMTLVLILGILLCAGRSHRRVSAWRNTESVYLQGIHDAGDSVAMRLGLGRYYLDCAVRTPHPAYLPAANRLLTHVARLDPYSPDILAARAEAAILEYQNATDANEAAAALAEGIRTLRMITMRHPSHIESRIRLGEVFEMAYARSRNRTDALGAIEVYRSVVMEQPVDESLWRRYHALLAAVGRTAELASVEAMFREKFPRSAPLARP